MSKPAKEQQKLKEQILDAAIPLFNAQGLKFTMDELAGGLSMSKKTIYAVFRGKEDLLYAMVDYCFDAIAVEKNAVMGRDLPLADKLERVLRTLSRQVEDIDLSQLHTLREKYPAVYEHVAQRLETGWEGTVSLLEQGMAQGIFRPVSVPIFKLMTEVTLEQFFQNDVLVRNGITYQQALSQVAEILVRGIVQEERP